MGTNECELPPDIPGASNKEAPPSSAHPALLSTRKELSPVFCFPPRSTCLTQPQPPPGDPSSSTAGSYRSTRGRWTGSSWKHQLHQPAGYQEPSTFLACHESCLVMGLPPPEPDSHRRRRNRPKYLSRSQMMVVGVSGRTPKRTKLPVTACLTIGTLGYHPPEQLAPLLSTPPPGCRLRTRGLMQV